MNSCLNIDIHINEHSQLWNCEKAQIPFQEQYQEIFEENSERNKYARVLEA